MDFFFFFLPDAQKNVNPVETAELSVTLAEVMIL